MDVKFQIFISSTYHDLIEERESAIAAILKIGHIPIGMEMFKAEDVDSWEVIKRTIESADYYIVIIGHKYGSIAKNGKSFTEMEYDYAVKLGIPALAFIIDGSAIRKASQMEESEDNRQKLKKFKKKLEKKNRDTWEDKSELSYKLVSSLTSQFNINPRPGWIRRERSYSDSIDELTRLSKENSELRERILLLEELSKSEIRKPLLKVSFSEDLSFSIKIPKKRIRIEKPIEDVSSYAEKNQNQMYNRKLSSQEQYNRYNDEIYPSKYVELNAKSLKISLSNIGNIKATLIDVEVKLPNEIAIFSSLASISRDGRLNEPDDCIDVYENQEMRPIDVKGLSQRSHWYSDWKLSANNTLKLSLDVLIHTKSNQANIVLLPLAKGSFEIEIKCLCNEYHEPVIETIPVMITG